MLICFASFSSAQSNYYETQWKKVQKLENDGLSKSASELVDQIYTRAKNDDNTAQKIKALLHQSKYLQILEEDSQLTIINKFKSEIESSDIVTKQVLENLLANLYWQYFKQNRYKFYDRSKTDVKASDDFRTWDLTTLFTEIHRYFDRSLQNGLLLQQESLDKYDAILKTVKNSKDYRPTLFDFLSHNALDFYKTSENSITQPSYKFNIDSTDFLSPSELFVNLNISSKDSVNLQLNALKVYQNLLRFHQKDKRSKAFISANIERLNFVKHNATFNNPDKEVIKTYEFELNSIKDNPVSALYSFEIASQLVNQASKYNPNSETDAETLRWKNKEALSICEETISNFPKSDGAKKCEVLVKRIFKPTLSLKTERYLPIDQPALILVNYKNLDTLDFDIHKVSLKQLKRFNRIYNASEIQKFISKLKTYKTFSSSLKNESDYQNHGTELVLPNLENGLFIVVAKTNTSVFATTDIQVTDMAMVQTQENEQIIYQIIDRNNGKPIANAKAELKYRTNRNYDRELSKNFTTDQHGKFYFKKNNNRYNSVYAIVSSANDTGVFGESYINRFYDRTENTDTNYKTFILTDRSIYRPGQTVYFKGISTKTEFKNPTIVASEEKITATLHDVNGQQLSELKFTTNEYGSFSGEFILPNGGLTGNYYIKTTSDIMGTSTEYFSVEEYKQPKFETNFIPVTETFKVNDSVTVRGNAMAFAGSNITDAQVIYRVKRQVRLPRWYYWGRNSYNSEAQEITFGETKTNAKGEFEITFKALPDESVSIENLPVFNYEITADVTDINGETRSASTTVRVGYHALTTNIEAPQRIDKFEKETELTITTSNLNGEFVPAKGSLKIYKLEASDYVLRNRPWQAPDYKLLSQDAFKAKFPHWSYGNEVNIKNWKKGKAVFETNFDTEKSKSVMLKRTKKWDSGTYIMVLESEDKFGQSVKDQVYTYLFSDADKTLADHKLFDISLDKTEYNSGETAVLTFGSSAIDVNITIEIEKGGKLIETEIHQLNNSKKTIQLPIDKSDVGGFVLHYSFSAFNDFKAGSISINVPYPKTDLEIETSTFRDKLQPGQDETWQFKIKGPKGDKVAAEVLASMYDASLDEFKAHSWNFNPIYRPNYNARFYKNSNQSYGISNFRRNNSFESIPNYPYQGFDSLDWFGFYFGNERLSRLTYRRQINEKNSKITGSYLSSIKNDSIKGIVTDFYGDTLPGVNIIIDGTSKGTQSDFDGRFSLKAKTGQTLNFSFLGMKSISHKINRDNFLNVVLAEDLGTLDEVVISGYSTTTKAKSSGSSVRVEAEMLEDRPNAGFVQTLSGQAPGLEITEGDSAPSSNINSNQTTVQIRKNLQETGFFFPQLQTDKDGNVSFNFKAPEALTKWKLQLLAHTKTLESSVSQYEAVTQKELMVIPNAPRFLRQGDKIVISTKIANLTDKLITGQVQLVLEDVITGKDISKQLVGSSAVETFSVDAKSNTQASWTLNIPDNLQAVLYKVIAQSEDFSDGEQNVLPVLTNRMLVTETLPMWVRSNQTKTFSLDKLKDNTSTTLKNHKLTLEITSNPAWYAVQALPYLMEYPYECNEQTFSRYYANALAQHITSSNPKIEAVFNQWKSTDALLSNLEKNQELKSLLIQETPWLRDAQSETEQKKQIALLFDLNKMNNELQSSFRKLKNNQHSSGAWPWFDGGRDNRYITQHIVSGFGHLNKLGVIQNSSEESMIEKAIRYLDKEFVKEYKNLKKYNTKIDLNKDHLSYTQMHYLYVRSFYPEVKTSNEVDNIMVYYKGQIQKYWLSRSLYAKGLMALIMHRNNDSKTSGKILKSSKENSITSDELGMYWKANTASWYWHQAPIETQALLIEAFSEVGTIIQSEAKNLEAIDNLKIWLLKNKQTNKWETTKATTEAVYALLLQGSEWLDVTDAVDVTVGDEVISPSKLENVKVEAGTGYYKTSWNGNTIKSEQAKVTLSKKGEGIAWGALYWQYFEDLDKITSAETPLKLEKKLFLKTNTDRGEEISEIKKGTKLNIGDLVKVRIELHSDRDMEFLHLKDMRAAGFEPINVLSKYKWQDGLGYYESTKDAATNFFIDYLPKGIYIFEYDLRVNNAGDMSNGITTIQSMYAPEFSSHSEGIRVIID